MALATEERILAGAVRALSESSNATVDQIAAEARVGRATVYRHFESRAGLLRALVRRAIAETDRVTRQATAQARTVTDALRLATKAVVGAGESFRFLEAAAELRDEPEIVRAYERQKSELADLVRASREEGFIRPYVPLAWVVASIDGLIWAAARAVGEGEIEWREMPVASDGLEGSMNPGRRTLGRRQPSQEDPITRPALESTDRT